LVSWFWTRRLPLGWLEKPRLGAIGAHPSLLPRHRGPNPYYAAIDSGDVVTGVSIHRLTAAYDEGNVLLRSELPVAGKNSWQLARALDRPSLRRLRQAVAELAGDQVLAEQAQDENMATWAPEPEGQALRADFRWPAAQVWRRLQALSPVPGLALEVAGIALFATRARLTDDFPKALLPGEAAVVKDSTLVIRCGDRAIAIERATLGQNADLPQSSEGSELDERTLGRLIASRLTESG
jgi:methionyl-tRNA formyltransferase